MKVLQVLIKTIDEKNKVKHWTDKDVEIDGNTIKLKIPKEPKKEVKKSEEKKEPKKDSKSSKKNNKK